MERFIRFLLGFVVISIKGGQTERFLTLCKNRGIRIKNISFVSAEHFTAAFSIKEFFLIQPLRKKTGVQIHILEKHGMPFFFVRNKKRKAFFLGISAGILLIILLSGRIWNIHVEGNVRITTPEILSFLEQEGVFHGISKKKIDCSTLAAKIRQKYTETSWVSAKIKGTRLILTLQEGDFIQEDAQETEIPCNLSADISGTIVKMITRSGMPAVRVGDVCEAGDILVVGRIDIKNDAQETVRFEYVEADADIYVKHNISYYYELPMEYEKEEIPEKVKRGGFLKIGRLYLEIGSKNNGNVIKTVEEYPFRITENFILPVSVGIITAHQYQKIPSEYTEKEAVSISWQRLQRYEEKLMEKGVQISENNVTIKVDHKICVSRGELEIIEKTGKRTPVEILEQPIERTIENG